MKHRSTMTGLVGAALALSLFVAVALQTTYNETPPATPTDKAVVIHNTIEFHMSLNCGCCTVYIEAFDAFAREAGFTLQVIEEDPQLVTALKREHGVPGELWSCHTMLADGYFMEGHVPLSAAQWLLTERPEGVRGISTLHTDGDMDPVSWLGQRYYVVDESGTIEGPLVARDPS